jgi:hypothetical protein
MPLHPLLPTVLLALSLAHLIAPQTLRTGKTPNTFEIVGHSGASAQMMFLGMPTKTYVIDKVQSPSLLMRRTVC